jgi:formamidopyrimidine-DNA glycosylase
VPELPEVETVRLGLQKYVAGLSIEKIDVLHPKIFEGSPKDVEGAKIVSVRRIGKGLILDLSNGFSLAIHIKMTGQLIFRDEKTKNEHISPKVGTLPNKFTHVVFHLSRRPEPFGHPEFISGSKMLKRVQHDKGGEAHLYYNDMRRFGWIKVIKTSEVSNLPFFKNMGPEPLKDLTLEKFQSLVSKASTKIKPFIMDQTKIGGIGNIYANDALFKAKIDPRCPSKSLDSKETKRLYDAIIFVLKKSLEEGGASELSFVNVLGQEGNYQNHTLVYGKTGKPCPRGDGKIQRISLGGRGTFFCPNCQH